MTFLASLSDQVETVLFVVLIVAALGGSWYLRQNEHATLRLLRQILLVLPAAVFYFLVRGFVDAHANVAQRNAQQVIDWERRLGLFHEQTVQGWVQPSHTLVTFMNWVYIWGHWPVITIVMSWIVIRHHDAFPYYRNAMFISGAVGMVIFALYPVAPPRLTDGLQFVDTVTQHSYSYRVLQPPSLTNPYAAMPSLHFGWDLLIGIAVFREARHRGGKLYGVLMPAFMFFSIVATGNHYFLDGIAGGLLVIASLGVSSLIIRYQSRPAAQVIETTVPHPPPELVTLGLVSGASGIALGNTADERMTMSDSTTTLIPGLDEVRRPFVVAHRFGNGLAELQHAEQAGADIVEADVWLYRGQLEVRHSKTAGPLPVLWDRWSLERGWQPRLTLPTLLRELDPGTLPMLDIKGRNPALPNEVVRAFREVRDDDELLICSQNWSMLERFRQLSDVMIVHSIGNGRQLAAAWDRLAHDDHDAVSIHMKLLDPEIVERLKSCVSTVMTWPINSEEQLETVLDWGVDGVISDNPDLMLQLVERRGAVV